MKLNCTAKLRLASVLALAVLLPMLCGCPDYSHQREVPDYGTMTDDAAAEPEE
jgi:ABC-type uncharacterized transport system auxiliary subunit